MVGIYITLLLYDSCSQAIYIKQRLHSLNYFHLALVDNILLGWRNLRGIISGAAVKNQQRRNIPIPPLLDRSTHNRYISYFILIRIEHPETVKLFLKLSSRKPGFPLDPFLRYIYIAASFSYKVESLPDPLLIGSRVQKRAIFWQL